MATSKLPEKPILPLPPQLPAIGVSPEIKNALDPIIKWASDLVVQLTTVLTTITQVINDGFGINLDEVGMVKAFAGATVPAGYLACDGSAVSRTTYASLFGIISTTWGIGDGSTTFNLPDFRGRALIGDGTGSGLTARTLAQTTGVETHTLASSEMPSHNHTQDAHGHSVNDPGHPHTVSRAIGASGSGGNAILTTAGASLGNIADSNTTGITIANATATNQSTGGGGAHQNMQPSAVIKWIIKYR